MKKKALLQCADQGPLESLVDMLTAVGYECFLPSERLIGELKLLGCDSVLSPKQLHETMGYDMPRPLPTMDEIKSDLDLYVDIKAHRNGPKVWKRYNHLPGRTLWYRINGGKPEITERGGDEVNLICPILTPNQWYTDPEFAGKSYVCWPPFVRFAEYSGARNYGVIDVGVGATPVCLIHNLYGWGHGDLSDRLGKTVRYFGAGSPNELVDHRHIPGMLKNTQAMVHLKSNDCPGYSLYEALASSCPVVVSRRMIWRMRMQSLYVEGENCYCFDLPTHDHRTEIWSDICTAEIHWALEKLSDLKENTRIGQNGRLMLRQVMWDKTRNIDLESFRSFMERNFPCA